MPLSSQILRNNIQGKLLNSASVVLVIVLVFLMVPFFKANKVLSGKELRLTSTPMMLKYVLKYVRQTTKKTPAHDCIPSLHDSSVKEPAVSVSKMSGVPLEVVNENIQRFPEETAVIVTSKIDFQGTNFSIGMLLKYGSTGGDSL